MDYGRWPREIPPEVLPWGEPRDGLRAGTAGWITWRPALADQGHGVPAVCGSCALRAGRPRILRRFFLALPRRVFPRVATEVRSSRCHGGVAPTLRRAGDEIKKINKFKGVRGEG